MKVHENLAGLRSSAALYEAPFPADVRIAAETALRRGSTVLYVATDERQSQIAATTAGFFAPSLQVLTLPAWDCLPYDRVSPTPLVAAQRCAVLTRLAGGAFGPRLVVATASALIQRTPPAAHFAASSLVVRAGGDISLDRVMSFLVSNAYVRAATVREPGEFAIRGGIVDLFPPGYVEPLRLDFFGDSLESIRRFDPETQRSTEPLEELALGPVSELDFSDAGLARLRTRFMSTFGSPGGDPTYEAARARIRRQGVEFWLPLFYDQLGDVIEFLGDSPLIIIGDGALAAAQARFDQAKNYFQTRLSAAEGAGRQPLVLPPELLFVDPDALRERLAENLVIPVHHGAAAEGARGVFARTRRGRNFAPERIGGGGETFSAVVAHIVAAADTGRRVLIAAWSAGSADRMSEVLMDHGLAQPRRVRSWRDAIGSDAEQVFLAELAIENGFEDDDIVLVTEQDVLGDKLARPKRRKSSTAVIAEATALSVGDLVVHVDHGVGRYAGLMTVTVADAPHDCLELVYAGGDKILLPVENAELVTRYGVETSDDALDRLGGAAWQGRKARARKRILEMAQELIALAAERELKQAPKTDGADGVFREFCARFRYDETDDQLNAIEDVVADLVSGRPMDRLICGDVGFGKTEVALRAAFLIAMSGLQVAVIAPTTLLARQHYATFSERFAGWPIRIGRLSRFVSAKEAADTRAEIADGRCDLVIGTHALLSNQVSFSRLGLVVVDEEQRFGVKHKEQLKTLKRDVHVLTLSATPIPRTLQMALTGIRDLSIIATPPVDRLAVRTFVVEFDPVTVREALLRERFRGGQTYFVAPRVSDLPLLERFLREQAPEVSFITAHGQMTPTDLEASMTAFYDGQADVLLSTTIVESGLDIPRANTLIVYRADMFGLAQLYQLRGRVGRAKLRAYAYLTTPEAQTLTDGADRRLKVLQSLDSLGGGFMLASQDLDMRGGGNLLGDEQSGHVREVGVELYQSMLEDAVKSLRSGATAPLDEWSPQIDIGAAVLIPDTYVEDLTTRLSLYRRLADVETDDEREAFAAELIDRFGPMPEETRQLLDITAVKILCKRLGAAKVSAGPKGLVIGFRSDAPIDGGGLVAFVHQKPGYLKLRPDFKLVANGVWPDARARMAAVRTLLRDLTAAVLN
ncbi:transcription-repair coupling factor [bacterium]|nr:transcription-repair coupling factor [bacterium]